MDYDFTIETGATGRHRAKIKFKNIAISCPNDSATEVTDTARNTIRLVVAAVGLGWFRSDAIEIGVLLVIPCTNDYSGMPKLTFCRQQRVSPQYYKERQGYIRT